MPLVLTSFGDRKISIRVSSWAATMPNGGVGFEHPKGKLSIDVRKLNEQGSTPTE